MKIERKGGKMGVLINIRSEIMNNKERQEYFKLGNTFTDLAHSQYLLEHKLWAVTIVTMITN